MASLRAQAAKYRRMGLPVVVGFFLILYGSCGLALLQEQDDQKSLEDQITLMNINLARPIQTGVSAELQSEFDAVAEAIPGIIQPTDVILAVLDVAKDQGIDISEEGGIQVVPGQARKQTLEDIEYRVLPFSISGIRGSYEQLLSFFSSLEAEPGLVTAVPEVVNIGFSGSQVNVDLDITL